MAILPDYTTGTITLTSGSKDFTTSGSALQSKQVRSGDMIYSPVTGMFLLIDAITGENSGTLAYDCPADAAVTDGPLRVRFQPDVSRYTAALYDVLDKLKSGNVDALAGLMGSAGKIPQFTGAGTMQLADYLVFNFRDDWATATDYVVNDVVRQGGNTYLCLIAHTSGTFATDLAAAKWDLFVPKGDQGIQGVKGDKGDQGIQGIQGNPGTPGVVQSIVAGPGIAVDSSVPASPKVTALAREVLTAARSYYVATTGNDANNGLTSGTAFLTIGKALGAVAALDMGKFQVTINVAAGFYNETVTLPQVVGSLPPLINGAGATSSTVSKIYASNNFSTWRLTNIGLGGSAGGQGMNIVGHAAVSIGNFDFGGTGRNQHARIESSAVLQAEGNFSISSGTAQQAFDAIHSDIAFQGRTITITTNISTLVFASARNAGYFQLWGVTFVLGSFTVTGKRYNCVGNGVLETGGVATYVPGTTDGSVASGGQYI